jgi:hypothetical protein
MTRELTARERAVLEALLAVDFPGVEELREQVAGAVVVDGCSCGCPSIDFSHATGDGIHIRVNAAFVDSPGDGMFLFTRGGVRGDVLGGIDWIGASGADDPDELPDPSRLVVTPADR